MVTGAVSYGNDRMKQQIEDIRDRMIELGAKYGLNDPQVLCISRELDALIVSYHKKTLLK